MFTISEMGKNDNEIHLIKNKLPLNNRKIKKTSRDLV